jgi:hypothetical protein
MWMRLSRALRENWYSCSRVPVVFRRLPLVNFSLPFLVVSVLVLDAEVVDERRNGDFPQRLRGVYQSNPSGVNG